jgi:hypothetical protein
VGYILNSAVALIYAIIMPKLKTYEIFTFGAYYWSNPELPMGKT